MGDICAERETRCADGLPYFVDLDLVAAAGAGRNRVQLAATDRALHSVW